MNNQHVTLDLSGLERLNGNRERVERWIPQKMAQDAETYAKLEVPVDTGALKNSIIAQPEDAKTWILHDGMEYGIFVEFGTSRMAAHPFFLPAVVRVRQGLPIELREILR